jgi:hypothetical protein
MTNTLAYILGIITIPALIVAWVLVGWYATWRGEVKAAAWREKYGKQYDNLSTEEKEDFGNTRLKYDRRDLWSDRDVYIAQGGKVVEWTNQ